MSFQRAVPEMFTVNGEIPSKKKEKANRQIVSLDSRSELPRDLISKSCTTYVDTIDIRGDGSMVSPRAFAPRELLSGHCA